MAEPWEYIHTKRVLNKYGLPAGAFDPEAPGEQTYDIYWMNIRTKRGTSASRPLTSLRLRSEFLPGMRVKTVIWGSPART